MRSPQTVAKAKELQSLVPKGSNMAEFTSSVAKAFDKMVINATDAE